MKAQAHNAAVELAKLHGYRNIAEDVDHYEPNSST